MMFWFSWLVDKCAPLVNITDADEFNWEEVMAFVEWEIVSSVLVWWSVVLSEYDSSFDMFW